MRCTERENTMGSVSSDIRLKCFNAYFFGGTSTNQDTDRNTDN